ncbi:hypothetical protein EHW99_0539 [Erwinia amylovora]|uniref:Uncharacterized protein n=2 Tax=Erwinia amylovora TaxID=552 RepID=A0A830ZVQ5_ERWAM|nr:hypothetical protein EaACW_3092 [Erwinia amylovora ACW56400]QJQ53246.1 hypothetical protein EHX00_0539 [Erwinia amylovora]CBA22958.1 hypothetical protein predicted by Glimmer/Critica [Erwinia amylovora CFBP1430]CCO79933.1 hypothetical protein BN432_3158 [Erwinia amylovora Ea356]CCO83738.1 hypothetical protein BN433_3184 [Erwinia amylovora Ea266]CCO87499.1 hypothetical protein BN434_3134 [Erwinia amylovora CFBP 2585]CCO91293.1 hypothetical protein BN435_3145 [Erwinia amylovora 01SFR-BO]CCO
MTSSRLERSVTLGNGDFNATPDETEGACADKVDTINNGQKQGDEQAANF